MTGAHCLQSFTSKKLLLAQLQRCLDQTGEQRVRASWAAGELWVSLRGDVVRVYVLWQFNELNQVAIWRSAREDQAGLFKLCTVRVVDLVAVAVALCDIGLAVGFCKDRAFKQLCVVQTQTHGAAKVALAVHDCQ